MISIRRNGFHQPLAIQVDDYNEELLTHDEVALLDELYNMHAVIPNLSQLLTLFCDNNLIVEGFETYTNLIPFTNLISESRLMSVAILVVRMKRVMQNGI